MSNENKPFHLATFILQANGTWRLRRVKRPNLRHCAIAWCPRERRSDKKSRLCHTCESREWRANHPVRAAHIRLRSHAKQRGILFDLTFDQFKRFVCESGNGYMEGKGKTFRSHLQIDRIDNLKGYTLSNIQVLTLSENATKGNRDCPF